MRHRIFAHIIWTTRDRAPAIDRAGAELLWRMLPRIARQERALVLEIGIVRTHVHLLIRLHPTTAIPRLMQRMKGGTSVLANRGGTAHHELRWARGYNITSVHPAGIQAVRQYVRNQHLRHPAESIPDWPPNVALATRAEPRL